MLKPIGSPQNMLNSGTHPAATDVSHGPSSWHLELQHQSAQKQSFLPNLCANLSHVRPIAGFLAKMDMLELAS